MSRHTIFVAPDNELLFRTEENQSGLINVLLREHYELTLGPDHGIGSTPEGDPIIQRYQECKRGHNYLGGTCPKCPEASRE